MKKSKIISIVVGLLLIVVSFVIPLSNRYRLILLIVGFILQIVGMLLEVKAKKVIAPILIVLYAGLLVLIDYVFVLKMNKLPILAIRNTVSANTKIYNGLFYRVWKCNISDEKIYVDKLYKSPFYCDDKELKKIDINEFLLHFEQKYKKYRNHFVKIEGKISEIEGLNYLEMKAYEFEVDKMNGYVVFDDNVKLRFKFNGPYEKLADYSVYDTVKVIGRVYDLDKNENDEYTINLKDSSILPTDVYDDFEIIVDANNNCSNEMNLYYQDKDNKYYIDCLNNMQIKYSQEDIYDLKYILQDKKVTLEDLYKKALEKEEYDDGGSVLYKFDNFNILKCNTTEGNKDIIFGNKTLVKTGQYCYTDTSPKESDEVVE